MTKNKNKNVVYNNMVNDKNIFSIMDAVRDGIRYQSFSEIAAYTPFTSDDWSNFLHLSQRTFQRYKNQKLSFDPIHSEKIIQIALLYNNGIKVFGDKEKFDNWLNTKNVALGGITPKSLLDNTFGITLITDELTRIEHGIFA